jgi:hypothetical protein
MAGRRNPAGLCLRTAQTLQFDSVGVLQTAAPIGPPIISFTPPCANAVSVTLHLGTGINGITSFAGTSTAVLRDQNGYAAGQLQNFSIDRAGLITGAFTNGTNVVLGRIVLADFNTPAGLLRVGDQASARVSHFKYAAGTHRPPPCVALERGTSDRSEGGPTRLLCPVSRALRCATSPILVVADRLTRSTFDAPRAP